MANPYDFTGLLSSRQPMNMVGGIDPLRGQSLMGQPVRMPAPSSMGVQLQQRMQPQQARGGGVLGGLGRAFTGEGSSARLSALGASLLQGPSRTPISIGSSLAQGLLAGNVAAQQEQERKFKRGLLEREMAVAEGKLKGPKTGNVYNVIKNGEVVSQVLENTPEFLSEVGNTASRLEKVGTTKIGGDIDFVDIYKKDPEDNKYKITQTVQASDAKQFEGKPE